MGRPRGQGAGEPKTSPRRVNVALRRAEAMKMRQAGATSVEIRDKLGYPNVKVVNQDIIRGLGQLAPEPAAELRALELARLDESLRRLEEARQIVLEVLARQHFTVSNGRVVYLGDEPLVDDGPVLQSVDRLVAIETQRERNGARRAKLLGLDAPAKVEMITDDLIDREIRSLTEQLAELDRAAAGEAADLEEVAD